MIGQWALWIGILLTLWGGGFYFISKRLIGTMNWPDVWKTVTRIVLFATILHSLATIFLLRYLEKLGSAWMWMTYVGMGFLSLVFTFLAFRDILWLVAKGVDWLAAVARSSEPLLNASRREFLMQATNLGVLGGAGVLTAYGVYNARRAPGIVNLEIPIKNLPDAFLGFRIVQITDIHAGLTVKRDWVETIARQVSELKPDLIAFTGDMADGSVPHLENDVAPLAELTAPHGKFFVTGNHEYYSGAEPWVEHIRTMGYDVLMNEHRIVSRNGSSIVLAGVTDYSGGQFLPHHKSDVKKSVDGAPSDAVKILMAHQPRSIFEADAFNFDLVLTGHTHGGQFFPWNLVATLGQPYIKGLHNRNGTWAYVSKGTGYWGPPVRLGTRSEITVFTLTAEAKPSEGSLG
jgi:hypothetical protein